MRAKYVRGSRKFENFYIDSSAYVADDKQFAGEQLAVRVRMVDKLTRTAHGVTLTKEDGDATPDEDGPVHPVPKDAMLQIELTASSTGIGSGFSAAFDRDDTTTLYPQVFFPDPTVEILDGRSQRLVWDLRGSDVEAGRT